MKLKSIEIFENIVVKDIFRRDIRRIQEISDVMTSSISKFIS